MDNPKVKMIESAFANYLMNRSDPVFYSKVSHALAILNPGKKFNVEIIKSNANTREPFFGMRVFPAYSEMDEILKEVNTKYERPLKISEMAEKWRNIKVWNIEIDDRTFDRNAINFNPEELTAMLLHEIGHIVYSETRIEVYYRCLVESKIRMGIEDKAAVKVLYQLYMIPLTLMCGFRNWNLTDHDLREEVFADKTVKSLGYGDHLVSAFNKIIEIYGSTSYEEEPELENSISHSFRECNMNIKDLVHRKNKLKDELYHTGIRTNSHFIRKTIKRLMEVLGIGNKEKYTGNVVLESYAINFDDPEYLINNDLIFDTMKFNELLHQIDIAKESALTNLRTKIKDIFTKREKIDIPTQYDVDTIYVEVDRIHSHADRRYVLDLIYHIEDRINNTLEVCEMDASLKRRYADQMNSLLKQIQDLRRTVLSKRNFNKQYKFFVRYPEGYEG